MESQRDLLDVPFEIARAGRLARLAGGSCAPLIRKAIALDIAEPIYRRVQDHTGLDFAEQVLKALNIRIVLSDGTLIDIPPQGPLIVVSNHPFGALDPLAALSLLGQVRDDVKLVANRAILNLTQLHHLLIPVPPPSTRNKSIGATRRIVRHLEADGVVLLFPSGQVSSFPVLGRNSERRWPAALGRLIRDMRVPVLPLRFEGRNSFFFYVLRALNRRFGSLLFLRELLRKAGTDVSVRVGPCFSAAEMRQWSDPVGLTAYLQSLCQTAPRAFPRRRVDYDHCNPPVTT